MWKSNQIGFCSFFLRSDQILFLFSQIGLDFVLILSVWKKLNDEKSIKFNEKSQPNNARKVKRTKRRARTACYPTLRVLLSQLSVPICVSSLFEFQITACSNLHAMHGTQPLGKALQSQLITQLFNGLSVQSELRVRSPI